MKTICIIKLGDIVEGLIQVLTFGRGKDIAEFIAHKLGYQSCGCEERRLKLNKLLGCYQKQIKLYLKDS